MIEIEENKTEEDIIKERDKQERKELIDFILELFDIEKPTGLILKQIKTCMKNMVTDIKPLH